MALSTSLATGKNLIYLSPFSITWLIEEIYFDGHNLIYNEINLNRIISLYINKIFHKDNLCYKRHETYMYFNDKNIYIDIDDDYETFEKQRIKIINNHKNKQK